MRSLCLMVFLATTATLAIADNPKQAAVHSRQGKAYFDAQQYDQAITEFKKAYDLERKSVTLFKIASTYYAKGDYAGAIDFYARYLASDPDGPLAQQALEFTTIANKALAEAKAKADADAKAKADADAKAKADADAEAKRIASAARIKQAEAFAQAGAWSSAGDEYRAAAEVGEEPDHLIEAAVAYAKQPDDAKARAAYLAYLDKIPLGPKSDAIRVRVAELTRAIDKAVAERAAQEKEAAELRDAAARRDAARPGSEDRADFEFAASLAPGVKLRNDNPFVLALRAEAALRLGRRVNLGVYAEYARLSTSGSCGTDLPGASPTTPFDIGPRNQLSKCSYFLPGLQLYVHVLPTRRLDPYVGLAPGFKIAYVDHTTVFAGMEESKSERFFGIILGIRAGVTYHLSPAVQAWTVGGFVEGSVLLVGDGETEENTHSAKRYLTMFVGARSTVTF